MQIGLRYSVKGPVATSEDCKKNCKQWRFHTPIIELSPMRLEATAVFYGSLEYCVMLALTLSQLEVAEESGAVHRRSSIDLDLSKM